MAIQMHIQENGPWKVDKWPDNFPEEYKEETLAAINSEIPWGCL